MLKKELNPEHGKRLSECLNDKKMSQKELAEKSGYTKQYISYIVTGKKNMSSDSAEIFANILEVRKEYLLCRDDFKNVRSITKYVCNQLDSSNDAIIALLNFAGLHITGAILECESGDTFTTESIPKICISEKDIPINGETIEICGKPQTPKSTKIYVEVGKIRKEIPQEILYYLYEDIIDYIRFKCNNFKEKYFFAK